MTHDPVGDVEFPHLNVMMLGCLSLRRCLISVSLMSRTFFTATSSPWNLPRKTAPCAPLPTHCRSEISSKGTSQDSEYTPTRSTAKKKCEIMKLYVFFRSTRLVITSVISVSQCEASKCQYVLLAVRTGRSRGGGAAEQMLGSCYTWEWAARTQLQHTQRQSCSNKWHIDKLYRGP